MSVRSGIFSTAPRCHNHDSRPPQPSRSNQNNTMGKHPRAPNGPACNRKLHSQAKYDRKARRAAERRGPRDKGWVSREDSRFWNAFFLYAPDALSIGARLVVLSFSVKCMSSVLFK